MLSDDPIGDAKNVNMSYRVLLTAGCGRNQSGALDADPTVWKGTRRRGWHLSEGAADRHSARHPITLCDQVLDLPAPTWEGHTEQLEDAFYRVAALLMV